MVAELVPDHLRGRRVASGGACVHQRDALVSRPNAERLPFERNRRSLDVILAVALEAANIDTLGFSLAGHAFGDLAHALARAVVDVVGGLWLRTRAYGLLRRRLQLVAIVPLHERQMGYRDDVAVRIAF